MSESRAGTVGKYRLIAEVGHGGMADVYLAVGSGIGGFNKLLVIKVMRDMEEGALLSMFLDEARLAARLNHPNVVQTYEVGQEGERYFLAMEYLDGPSFRRLRSRAAKVDGALPLPLSLFVLSNVLQGLEYAHELKDYQGNLLNVVHRDLTPHNVLVTYEGEAKIVDFGIAKAADSSVQTQGGIFKGKVTYAPPEQLEGRRVDRRADVYAAGIMLWEAAANARMWGGVPEQVIAQRMASGDLPKLLEVNPNAPKRLVEIIDWALEQDLEKRCPTARALQEAIDNFARDTKQVVGRRDLSECVGRLFAEDRARMREVIEAQIKAIEQNVSPAPVAAPLPKAGFQTGSRSSSKSGLSIPSDQIPTRAGRTGERLPPPVAQRAPRSRLVLAAAVGAGVLLVGGLGWAFLAPKQPPLPATSAPVAPPTPPVLAQPEVEEVELDIRVTPLNAQLVLDGTKLTANPFHGKFAKGDQPHRLVVSAEGFATVEKEFLLKASRTLELALEPIVAVAPALEKPPTKPGTAAKPGKQPQKPAEDDLGF